MPDVVRSCNLDSIQNTARSHKAPNVTDQKTENTKSDSYTGKGKFELIDLKFLDPIDAQKDFYSKVISFKMKKGVVPKIAYSRLSKSGKSDIGLSAKLDKDVSHNDESVKITRKTTTDNNTGEVFEIYTIGIKKGYLVNFVISTDNGYERINSNGSTSKSSGKVSSDSVLPYANSGDKKYSPKHSIFATSSQDKTCPVSYPGLPFEELDIKKYASSKGTNYSQLTYGVPLFREMAQAIANTNGTISIEEALVKACDRLSELSQYSPQYRIGDEAKCDPKQNFEVLFIIGQYNGGLQEKAFKIDAEVVKDAITTFYPDKCKHFQTEVAPRREAFKTMLEERIQSAKANGRKLYVFYTGHGGENGYQTGISDSDKGKQGSKEFKFCINDYISESEMKDLLNKYGEDVEICIPIDACHGNAAVTATERNTVKRSLDLVV